MELQLNPIRKITIGSPRDGLHYVVGNPPWKTNCPYIIHDISLNEDFLNVTGIVVFDVYVVDDFDEVHVWKSFPMFKKPDKVEYSGSIESIGVTAIEYELMRDKNEITR